MKTLLWSFWKDEFTLHFSFLSDLATRQMNIKVARKWENITEKLHAVSSFKAGWVNNSERKYYSVSWPCEEPWRTVKAKVSGNTERNHDCFTQTGRMALSLAPLEAGCSMGGRARAEGLEKQQARRNLTQSHLSFVTTEPHCFVAELRWQEMAPGCEFLSQTPNSGVQDNINISGGQGLQKGCLLSISRWCTECHPVSWPPRTM